MRVIIATSSKLGRGVFYMIIELEVLPREHTGKGRCIEAIMSYFSYRLARLVNVLRPATAGFKWD